MYCVLNGRKFGDFGDRCAGLLVSLLGHSRSSMGNQGLDINNPDQKYRLKAFPGQFSGLHLVSSMYAAFRQIDPGMDLGMDFEAEYKEAMELKKV